MIKEDYVSFEVAKMLEENGFSGIMNHGEWYVIKPFSTGIPWNSVSYDIGETTYEYKKECCIPRPTIQMAMKWLEVEHRLLILKDYVNLVGNIGFLYQLSVVKIKEDGSIDEAFESYCVHDKDYNNGCNRIIKHCLKHLI